MSAGEAVAVKGRRGSRAVLRWAIPLAALSLGLCQPASGQVVSAHPDAIGATIYRDPTRAADQAVPRGGRLGGLVLITEERTVDLPAGVSRVSFRDVADTIVPQTATLEGLMGRVVEQNFDYDLLSPAALAAKSVGARVRLVSTNPVTGQETERSAILRSSASGIVLDFDGKLEGLHCSGGPERLVFDRVPTGLADRPVLSMVVNAPTAGPRRVRLSYLATGFDWAASYVARIHPDGRRLDLSGWITMANGSTATLAQAPVQLIAGTLNRVGSFDQTTSYASPPQPPQCWPALNVPTKQIMPDLLVDDLVVTGSRVPAPALMSVSAVTVVRDIGDYKLYALPFATTLSPRQTKQVAFLDHRDVAFSRVYRYDVQASRYDAGNLVPGAAPPGEEPASALIRIRNVKASKLGVALPSGLAEVLEPGGRAGDVLAGEDAVEDTPIGLEVELTLGRAQDVRVTPVETQLDSDVSGRPQRWRRRYVVTLFNGKPVPITLDVRHQTQNPTDVIVSESQRHKLKKGLPVWTVRLKPGQRRALRYDVLTD